MKRKYFWWALAIAWCLLIFFMSDKPAVESAEESMTITTFVNQLLSNIFRTDYTIVSDNFIRKAAHFTEYFILGFIFFKAYFNADKLKKTFWLSVVSAVAYAVTDEVHQYFIPGRAMRFTDVLIDSAGIMLAAFLLYRSSKKRKIR